MSDIKNELSKKNEFYIPKYRMLELRNFCLQYVDWKAMVRMIDGYKSESKYMTSLLQDNNYFDDSSVEITVLRRNELIHKIWVVDEAAKLAAKDLAPYIIKGVTIPESYDILDAKHNIPCSRNEYYKTYRKFFYVLDKIRG